MKEIRLTKGYTAIIDLEDYERIKDIPWQACLSHNNVYAANSGKGLYLHRMIMNAPKGKQVDHINGNSLDNRKSNLRICEPKQNTWNRRCDGLINGKPRTSKYKGVSWYKLTQKWVALLRHEGRLYSLGYFKNEIDAAKAYDAKVKELRPEYANLNFD